MKPDMGMLGKLTQLIIGLSVGAVLIAIVLCYAPVIRHNERLRKEMLRLDAQIQKAQEERKQLETSIKLLSRDPKAVERLAREKLGYAKPGETLIRFTAATNNPAPQ